MHQKKMDEGFDRLVEDSGFLRYHAACAQRREFNAFDVLRYAEYEIRHSNVLAWLLDPGETHGIRRAFLAWFLGRVSESIPDRGEQRVRVEREQHRVDITIFLEGDRGRHIVAIENKTGGYSPEHSDQVLGYAKVLREEYPEHALHNVLLTTSREVPVLDQEIAHVSWSDIRAQIEEIDNAGRFEREEVAAFVRQYLAAVDRLLGPGEHDDHDFRKLLSRRQSLLRHVFEVLVSDGDDGVRATVPNRHAHYRDTVVRLARDFGQQPKRLRDEAARVLEGRGMAPTKTSARGGGAYWLNWDLVEAEALGIGGCIKWTIEFLYREVRALLQVPPDGRGETVDRILRFLRATPVDRRRRDRYPMSRIEFDYFDIYSHRLVGDDILSGRSTAAVTEAVEREVKNFLDSDDSDYRRIGDYFKCLAFRHDGAVAPVGEG